jgi:hypothetical protein
LITTLSVTTVNALSWGANTVGYGPGGPYWDDGLGSWVGGYGGFAGPGGAGWKGGSSIWGGGYGGYVGPEWSNYAASVRDCVNPYNSPWRAEVCRRSQSQRDYGMEG